MPSFSEISFKQPIKVESVKAEKKFAPKQCVKRRKESEESYYDLNDTSITIQNSTKKSIFFTTKQNKESKDLDMMTDLRKQALSSEAKRNNRLNKNRMSALKSRGKKREYISNLEMRAVQLEKELYALKYEKKSHQQPNQNNNCQGNEEDISQINSVNVSIES